jgi:hypothetical protein
MASVVYKQPEVIEKKRLNYVIGRLFNLNAVTKGYYNSYPNMKKTKRFSCMVTPTKGKCLIEAFGTKKAYSQQK